MNVKVLIDTLIFKLPQSKPFLSNVLSAEIKDKTLTLIYPDFLKSYGDLDIINFQIGNYLWEKNHIELNCLYRNFTMPHLPHPAQSSKHNNRLFFIKLTDYNLLYTIIDKKKFYEYFGDEKKSHSFLIHKIKINSRLKLFDLFDEILAGILPVLKDEYRYLHPIVVMENRETFFYFEMLFEKIFQYIETYRKINDVRRFVGPPCFSFIDYFELLEVEDES